MRSKILEFIRQNPENWEMAINAKLINTSHDGSRVCFKYRTEADFSDPIVCEARGIIIDIEEMKVVCRPFDKFFNVQEQYAADIDWETARVLEKVDGSLIKLYWYDSNWVFATSSTCDASSATISGKKYVSYYDLIKQTDNYGKIPFDTLNKDCTYLFELVSPYSQVVIKYNKSTLYFLAARRNEDGEEIEVDLGDFRRPRSYPMRSIEECMDAAEKLNTGIEEELTDEGFVVVDGKCDRIKIKSPVYLTAHKKAGNRRFTARRMCELFMQGTEMTELVKKFPEDAYIIKYYDWQFEELRHKVGEMVMYARALYEEYDHDRRAVAKMIAKASCAWAGFLALDTEDSSETILQSLTLSKLEKYIRDYEDAKEAMKI